MALCCAYCCFKQALRSNSRASDYVLNDLIHEWELCPEDVELMTLSLSTQARLFAFQLLTTVRKFTRRQA